LQERAITELTVLRAATARRLARLDTSERAVVGAFI
jgi:hypothetical protein